MGGEGSRADSPATPEGVTRKPSGPPAWKRILETRPPMGHTTSTLFTRLIPRPLETTPVCPADNLTKDVGPLNWSAWGSQDLDPGERQTAPFTTVYIFSASKLRVQN